MYITVDCKCGKQFRVKEEHAGKRTKCPGGCGNIVAIPALELRESAPDDDPFINPMWAKPKESQPVPPPKPPMGNARFLVTASVLGSVFLIGGLALAHRIVKGRQTAEANASLHRSLTEAIESAKGSISNGEFTKAVDALRQVVEPKPAFEKNAENKDLFSQAEALMAASQEAVTDAKANEYLDRLDDATLLGIREGRFELTSRILDPTIKKVVQDKFVRLVQPIQARRKELAKEKREKELAADPTYQKQMFLAWVAFHQRAIMSRDAELASKISEMESEYRSSLFKPMETRQIENILDEWGEKRERMLEARTKEIGDVLEDFTKQAMKHQFWRVGTKEEQLSVAEQFGTTLNNMVTYLEKPVENQLASLEQTFGNKLQRGVRQLGDLNKRMQGTAKYYEDTFKGRIATPPR